MEKLLGKSLPGRQNQSYDIYGKMNVLWQSGIELTWDIDRWYAYFLIL
jgi:hypothetical protein